MYTAVGISVFKLMWFGFTSYVAVFVLVIISVDVGIFRTLLFVIIAILLMLFCYYYYTIDVILLLLLYY